jgi:integrase
VVGTVACVAAASTRRKRPRGSIDRLPSGRLRVRVYAGFDPVTEQQRYLTEVIEQGPKAEAMAEKARTKLLSQVDERRHPRTGATLTQLLERHLSMLSIGPSTMRGYRTYIERHIAPLIGGIKVGDLDADVLDSFYAELRRCQDHCRGRRRGLDHRTRATHRCDEHEGAPCSPPDPNCSACLRRCPPHQCRPLSDSTIRQIHYVLSGAYKRAVRWRWTAVSPIAQTEPPPTSRPDPRPPSVEEAARIINEAWRDPDWGALVWLAVTTGARRGELCALRWSSVDLDRSVLTLRTSVAKDERGRWYLKDTKTHQQRRIALDPETVSVLAELRSRSEARVGALRITLDSEAFVFSLAPDHNAHLLPSSVTQRYSKLASRLGIETHLHALRHYSATELIAAGVDVRTVAGRLGHSGGGTTTLRVYSAWRDEADQRAATNLGLRMPTRPDVVTPTMIEIDPVSRHEEIAVTLRDRIMNGVIAPGLPIASMKQLAVEHAVSVSTARQAVSLLAEWGLVDVGTGRRTLVRRLSPRQAHRTGGGGASMRNLPVRASMRNTPRELLDLEFRRLGRVVSKLRAAADPKDAAELRQLLLDAVRRAGGDATEVGDYEMVIRRASEPGVSAVFVASSP